MRCMLSDQGMTPGSCNVVSGGKRRLACAATLREEGAVTRRLIHAVHLSRPENYLSIYQSGCNMSCRKCHSWQFSQFAEGEWVSPDEICLLAMEYEKQVTLVEPRAKATAWHSHESCRCCGRCVLSGRPSSFCPGKLRPDAITVSPQGFGPARNIVAFTGGDLLCRPKFYAECARLIKSRTNLWVLCETNGYGLTGSNLDRLKEAGVDAFWLDIKAFDPEKHRWLTGCGNEHILKLPEEILQRGFVLEVLSLYIPGLVEEDELAAIAEIIMRVAPETPFTILAFFPQYRMKDFRAPTVREMVGAYQRVKALGLKNIRLGNVGVFARSEEDLAYLLENVGLAV